MTQNDVMQLLIGKDIGAVPSVAAGSQITKYDDLVNGEIAVVNAADFVLDASTVLTDDLVSQYGIKLVQRSGTKLIHSDFIKAENIRSYKGQTDAAAVEQVSYIGYNGTDNNDIEVVNSKMYVVRLLLKETDVTGFGQEMILNCAYKSGAAATNHDIALGLAQALSRTLRRQFIPTIKAELVNGEAVNATNDFLADATVINGENSFTVPETTAIANDAGQYATSTEIAVGDYVRIGTVGGGTAVTDGVYRVTAVSGVSGDLATITVDRPIEAASGTYAAATSDIVVLPKADAEAEEVGIKLTGIARPFTDLKKHKYSKVSFDIGLDSADSFGDTPVTYDTAMSLGHGTYEQIAQLEYQLLGNKGDEYRGDFLYSPEKADATAGKLYDQISISYFGDHPTGGVGTTPQRNKQLLIAFETGFANNEAPDIVVDVLDAYSTVSSGIGV